MLNIFKEDQQSIHLKLIEEGESISLVACDRQGTVLDYLLEIDRETLEIARYELIDPDLGFELNSHGELIIN